MVQPLKGGCILLRSNLHLWTRPQPKQMRQKHDSYKLCPLKGFISFQKPFLFSVGKIFHRRLFLFTSCNRIRGSSRKIFMVPKLEAGFGHFSSLWLMIQPELIAARSRWDHKSWAEPEAGSQQEQTSCSLTNKQKQKWDERDPLWGNQKHPHICLVLGKCRIKNPLCLFTILTGVCLLPLFTISPFNATFSFCYNEEHVLLSRKPSKKTQPMNCSVNTEVKR